MNGRPLVGAQPFEVALGRVATVHAGEVEVAEGAFVAGEIVVEDAGAANPLGRFLEDFVEPHK